ncbi:MAG: TlpA family protein disulfide reductase [Candidatus Aureabacteria bacterium]|nr:TlpA family protein disulfide reductase [Candidatus Auribacterota bacterium]
MKNHVKTGLRLFVLAALLSITPVVHSDEAESLEQQASKLSRENQFEQAAELYLKISEICRAGLASDPENTGYKRTLKNADTNYLYNKGQRAYLKMKEAEKAADRSDFDAASAEFEQAASMYLELLKIRDEKAWKGNYEYCLDQPGYRMIRYAERLMKEKKYGPASDYFRKGMEATRNTVKILGERKGFLQNIEYANHFYSVSRFEDQLEKKFPAPPFQLESFSGTPVALSDFSGKIILLEFWALWCPACVEAGAELKKLYSKYNQKGLIVLAVSVDKISDWKKLSDDKIRDRSKTDYGYPVLWGTQQVMEDYGNFEAIPVFILIDRQGNLYKRFFSDEWSLLENEIEGIL